MSLRCDWKKIIEEKFLYVLEFGFFAFLIGGLNVLLGLIVATVCVLVDSALAKSAPPREKWPVILTVFVLSVLANALIVWLGLACYFSCPHGRMFRSPYFIVQFLGEGATMMAGGFGIGRFVWFALLAFFKKRERSKQLA